MEYHVSAFSNEWKAQLKNYQYHQNNPPSPSEVTVPSMVHYNYSTEPICQSQQK